MDQIGTMTPQLQAEIDFVVGEYVKHTSRSEIKQSLMQRHGCSWNEAEEFVAYVDQHHHRSIARRQLPLLLVLGIVGLIGGCGLLGYSGLQLMTFSWSHTLALRSIAISLASGFVMLVGALIGLWQNIRDAWR